MPPHPLQPALDRATRALYTVTDLVEIAKGRKAPSGRSDTRQSSLYRAIVAASVGSVEETTEALVTESLRHQFGAGKAIVVIQSTISRLLQTPNSQQIRKLMSDFTGYDPINDLRITLRTSKPAYRKAEPVGAQTSHELWTMYNQERTWQGEHAAAVWDRFVRIRHSFAHQDSSVTLFTPSEVVMLRNHLSKGLAADPDQAAFVEQVTASAAVRVLTPAPSPQDPVRDWRLHETQAINALLCSAGIISSMADGLATYLDANGLALRANFDQLILRIEKGDWADLAGPTLSHPTNGVPWEHIPYRPGSR